MAVIVMTSYHPELSSAHKNRLLCVSKRMRADSYDEFVTFLEKDISEQFVRMESASDKHYCAKEDSITNELAGNLINLGYDDADEQTKKNGAVDLTVSSSGYTWIAEAKLGKSNPQVFEGLLQLVTRYVKRDKQAGLLVYCQKAGAVTFFTNFSNYLKNKKWQQSATIAKDAKQLQKINNSFNSLTISNKEDYSFDLIVNKPSGVDLKVKCICLDVAHEPMDASGRAANSLKLENARLDLIQIFEDWKETDFEDLDQAKLKIALGDFLEIKV
ncbi:hypothetical protein I6F48_16020 [Pseudoalteromonas sp. SWYJ118]|uniref:hypothetical protein n=1 Tax=Pseudoalteromonas sp. SWYJ118 TaxID=2792062 RepID=UPI0018CD323A|nr:hypothetical protein [Pseudoalteromonas sp. SWYJ118]MBH0077033.1 hypothetical protein [Pseudoalteromonas sp. SWYJ118]